MIPFGNQTVTLFARKRVVGDDGRSRDEWVQHTLTGCSWRHTGTQLADGNAVRANATVTCRIPGGQAMPQVGDVLIPGKVSAPKAITTQWVNETLESNRESGAFRVATVQNNAMLGFPMPHYAARG